MENSQQVIEEMSGGSIYLIIHKDIIQRSPDWYQIRLGRVGGTDAEAFAVKGKSASGLGAGALSIMNKKLYELLTGNHADENGFVSDAMQRGIDLEPEAVQEYETRNLLSVEQIGYVTFGPFFGYSPDGFVGEDGLIEVKCPQGPEYVRMLSGGEIKPEYYAQMQYGMFLTNRDWCDFVCYNPDVKMCPLIVKRVDRDLDFIDKIRVNMMSYLDEVEVRLNYIKTNAK